MILETQFAKKYKLICFDVDGTLYPVKQMHKYLIKLGICHPFVCGLYGKMRTEFRRLQDDFNVAEFENIKLKNIDFESADFATKEAIALMRVSKKIQTVEQAKRFLQEKYYFYLYKCFKKIQIQPETVKTLTQLKQNGIKIGVLSDWSLCEKLKQIGVENLLDFGFEPNDTGFLKPSVHCFEYLLYNKNVDASDVLYVGDSYDKDVIGATNAGLDAVLINCKKSDCVEKYPKAIRVFKDWKSFDKWLFEQDK